MKPINQTTLLLTSLALLIGWLIGCHGANKTSGTQPAEMVAQQPLAEIAVQQEEPAKAPYIISTKKQLEDFSRMVNEGVVFENGVKLGTNIMLNDTADWQNWDKKPPADSWEPIKNFNGTFDGNGYVISGVYVNSKHGIKGFFVELNSSAEVKNLGIVASYIKGGWVGGLAGSNEGLIVNSYFAGTVIGLDQVGGLVGFNEGTINNCYSSGIVIGSYDVGGLVGRNFDVIVNSHSSGTVNGKSTVGGLVGYIHNKAIINSYSTASVNGVKEVGGLVGMTLFSLISNSYSSGTVKGTSRTGGLVGHDWGCSSIVNCYSNGLVTGGKNEVNGMIGFNGKEKCSTGGAVFESIRLGSYYDKQTSKQNDQCKYAGKTTAEMKQKATYASWDFENVWAINDTVNNGYPYLLGSDYIEKHEYIEPQKPDYSRLYRENTCPEEAVIITNAKELADFAKAVNNGKSFLNKNVMLDTNIMLNDTTNWRNWESEPPENKWLPIGTRENKFNGTFNGNGFAISGVYINNSKNEQSLFGAIDKKGTVKNLGVVASYIKGKDKIGGIAGINLGEIYGCYFTGIAKGINDVGGLAGESAWRISNSYSAGIVTGANNVGGLAGATSKNEIYHSFSASIVTGTKSNIGGLVGSGKKQRIVNSYSAGKVTGVEGSTGGLAGVLDLNSYIINNYSVSKVNVGIIGFTSDLVGNYQGAYSIGNYYEGNQTPAEMKQKETFDRWDFQDNWDISDTINCGYPYLLGFNYSIGCGVSF